MRRLLLTAAACGMLLGSPVAHAGQSPCRGDWSEISADVAKHTEIRVVELSAAQRDIIAAKYNAKEPVTDDTFRHIYTLARESVPVMLLVLVRDDVCIVHMEMISPDEMATALTPDHGV